MLLYSAYRSAMREARTKRLSSIGFSLLSAGIFRGSRSRRDVLAIGALAVRSARPRHDATDTCGPRDGREMAARWPRDGVHANPARHLRPTAPPPTAPVCR